MAPHQHQRARRTTFGSPEGGHAFASVYVDWKASADAVQAAVAMLPMPHGVTALTVDDRSMTYTFGCRIAVDLTGSFDEQVDGPALARSYALQLTEKLGVPAFALYDLLRDDCGRSH